MMSSSGVVYTWDCLRKIAESDPDQYVFDEREGRLLAKIELDINSVADDNSIERNTP